MDRFSPSEAALEGFRVTREHPGTIVAWSFIYMGGLFLIALAMMATLGPAFITMAREGKLLSAQTDPEQMADMLLKSWPAFLLVLFMTVVLMSMIMGGIFRLILRPQEHGFAHLRLGRDELRLAAVNLLLVVVGVVFLAVGLLLSSLAVQAGPAVGFLVSGAYVVLTLWIAVRLALVTPMTFDLGRIAFVEAWRLSNHQFWRLLGTVVLAVIFYLIVWVLMSIISLAVVELSGGEDAMKDIAALTPVTALAAVATLVLQFLLQILQIVMIYGPFAEAYKQMKATAPAELAPAP
jgi:hypothetical protein